MPDGDALIEASEAGGGDCGGVTLHQQKVGAVLEKTLGERSHRSSREDSEILTVLHEPEVDVGFDPEHIECLSQHFTMLRGRDDEWREKRVRLHGFDDRGHLDGFRACADDDAHLVERRSDGHQRSRRGRARRGHRSVTPVAVEV